MRWGAAAALVAVLVAPSAAQAHEVGTSALVLEVVADGGTSEVTGEVQIPLDRLDVALGSSYVSDPAAVDADAEELRDYVAAHLAVTDSTGTDLTETVGRPTVEDVDGTAHLAVPVTYTGGASGDLTVTSDLVIETLRSHRIVVVVDDRSADETSDQVVAGTIDLGTPSVVLTAPSTGTTVGRSVVLGMQHVLDGLDHLLFMACLLLVAPLAVVGRRWRRADEGARPTVRRVVHTATAFTVAHSLTLIAAARGWVVLPTAPVETLIGLSLVVAAVHVIRPLVPGRGRAEPGIAFGFGLVHGLAFAALTASLGVDGAAGTWTLLGFNLGVEVAQLIVVAAVLPSLLLLARTPWYRPVTVTIAVGAALLALGWTVERAGGPAGPVGAVETVVLDHALVVVGLLAALAVAAVVVTCRREAPASVTDRAQDDVCVALGGGPTIA